MSRASTFEWLKGKIAKLKEFTNRLVEASGMHYAAHTWTALKLIALMWWVDVYTRIIPKYRRAYWYVDLLAGSGTNYIKETGDIIVGSPFIAYFFAHESFKRYVFMEKDRKRASALMRRASCIGIPDLVDVCIGDCNELITRIGLDRADHVLAFIDCEGLDVAWDTVAYLLRKPSWSDVIIVFQTQALQRTLGRALKGRSDERTLTRFMGDKRWQDARNADELLQLYMNRLREFRDYVESIRVRGEYSLDIILACRQGDYTSAWDYLRRKFNYITSRDAELALRICKGELRALNEFFPDLQRKLTDFLYERESSEKTASGRAMM